MKVFYADEALADIAHISDWLIATTPRSRLLLVNASKPSWRVSHAGRKVRVSFPIAACSCRLTRSLPYVIFYRVAADAIEILHIHHAARQSPDDDTKT
jgi:toxin ParE1/3/4